MTNTISLSLHSGLQANASSPAWAEHPRSDQDNSVSVQCCDQFHEGVDITSDYSLAGFHSLDRRHRKARLFGELALINTGERARGAHLGGSDHRAPGWNDVSSRIIGFDAVLLML